MQHATPRFGICWITAPCGPNDAKMRTLETCTILFLLLRITERTNVVGAGRKIMGTGRTVHNTKTHGATKIFDRGF